jgi:LmbE family N-acetylglucosaminyl deacetylase
MRRALVFGIFLVVFDVEGQRRAVRHPSAFPNPQSVLWIAAHPDDEAVAAPLLSLWCREQGARCAFLLLTRGEAGGAAGVRAAEAGAAAEYFRAESIHLRLPDGGGVLTPPWRADAAETLARYIEAVRPELILTFDPRHGTTCHPDHRETGRLVLKAVERLTFTPEVYLLESVATLSGSTLRIAAASPEALRFDAASRWTEVEQVMLLHRSQFPRLFQVPPEERAVYLAPAKLILGMPVTGCAQ